ncbi:hypothetical protein BY458DRAFT_80207 [Sporodiniella umbellata]|nr:hypothetical protein BY458DRAFT_80207 [Sporodiniella umbellata]
MSLQGLYPKCRAYPPVPNWYSPNATAISDSKFFLYATRNIVVILDLQELKYFNSFAASLEKINAIDVHSVLCFTAGADKLVCVWNMMSNTLAASHGEHKEGNPSLGRSDSTESIQTGKRLNFR